MDKPVYDLKSSADGHFYFFESNGEKAVNKAIVFMPISNSSKMVELVFGDIKNDNSIDFYSASENNDLIDIISTVIESLKIYLTKFPDMTVYFRGSTPSRTRLYRAAIAKNLDTNELIYDIFGILENQQAETFNKNHTYIGYIIRKKYEKKS
jgi:hypothetical protein